MNIKRTHLVYRVDIGNEKPENIINQDAPCPFCDKTHLVDVLEERGEILFIKNKYPVLQEAFQTVLIETDNCNGDLSVYSKEHLYAVLHFGMEKWLEMKASGKFASVIFYKNHGPCSGGTIKHPHMQIVGLQYIDCHAHIQPEQFEGIEIHRTDGVVFNLSTKPKVGFHELNIILYDSRQIDRMADYIQVATHYVLNYFHKRCNSYNLFFYDIGTTVVAKIMPRFVTSPLFIGYSIPHVSNRCKEIVQEIKDCYYSK